MMNNKGVHVRAVAIGIAAWAGGMFGHAAIAGQAPAAPQAPQTPQASAPIDLTGYWVSIVTESWRFRMVTPARGDYASIPITKAALDVADRWNAARDTAEGNLCKAYGGAAMLNIPGRLHISWQDENTLKIEMDNGQQTRLLHFGKGDPGAPSLQGYSTAEWVNIPRIQGGGQGPTAPRVPTPKGPGMGTLKVRTTNLLPGYLRKNGVPHSADAVVTEFWDLRVETDGKPWITVTVEVNDPLYLLEPYLTSPNFRKEADGSKWSPEPCGLD
ncbi:MAG: hypothetical protein ABL964_16215 [Steroidobacteraceae bacterium]